MKIVVIGTRGIPDIQGGVETHCRELYPRLAAMGYDITLLRRSSYLTDKNKGLSEYNGVKLCDIYAPRRKSLEAIVHTFLGILKAKRLGADIVHIHAIGPAIMTPFARLMGLKVVSTNHGPDYDRQKWGRAAKAILRFGEKMSARFSNKIIVISTVISNILKDQYGRTDTNLIYNGVNIPEPSTATEYIESLGLTKGKYIVALGRFVKEKGFHDLIEAFTTLTDKSYKLVIAGDADHEDEYSKELKRRAKDAGVVLTGFISGEPLHQLMSGAALMVMPSYHEGLPIALLEAMSYKRDVAVSDIPANRLKCLDDNDYFPVGDITAISAKIDEKLKKRLTPRSYDLSDYNWDNIAAQTAAVYESAMKKPQVTDAV